MSDKKLKPQNKEFTERDLISAFHAGYNLATTRIKRRVERSILGAGIEEWTKEEEIIKSAIKNVLKDMRGEVRF